MYEVKFAGGTRRLYAANNIAQEIYSQGNADGQRDVVVEEILDYCKDPKYAVSKSKQYFYHNGRKCMRRTTAGWKILTRLKDQSEMWVPLSQLKESSPVKLAVFAQSKGIADEPVFSWWVPYTLKKADRIICKIKSRIKVTTHKYGVEIPKSIADAKRLDE